MSKSPKHQKTKKFLNKPNIHGGKEQLKKFIKENLQYPEEALKNQIQGDVIVKYKINEDGEVFDPVVSKSIGYGCDEEAVRLVKLIAYDPVKNRGVKVTAHNKIKIPFRLPDQKQKKFNMVYTPPEEKKKPAKEEKKPGESSQTTYNYTIKL